MNVIAKNIKVEQLGLSREAFAALGNLAIEIELNHRVRFPITKTVESIVLLLRKARSTENAKIKDGYEKLLKQFTKDCIAFLEFLGHEDGEPIFAEQDIGNTKNLSHNHRLGARN